MARDSKLESGRRIVFGINYSEFPNGSGPIPNAPPEERD